MYAGCYDDYLYAHDGTTGTEEWSFKTGLGIESSPAVGSNGIVYVASDDGKLYAVNGANGLLVWSQIYGGSATAGPAIDVSGTIYLGSKGVMYAFGATAGAVLWAYTAGGNIEGCPAISPEGIVYFGALDGRLYALDGASAAANWTFLTDGPIYCSPAIASDGTIYVDPRSGSLYAVSPNGLEQWRFSAAGVANCDPAIGADGTVYACCISPQLASPQEIQIVYALSASALTNLYASPSTLTGGGATSGVVQISAAGPYGYVVNLQSNSAYVSVPSIAVVPPGATGVSFQMQTSPVSSTQLVTITAALGGTLKQTVLTLNPYPVSSFYASPSAVIGGTISHGVVQLAKPAVGPETISLMSGTGSVIVPASVTIPGGATGASFVIATTQPALSEDVTLTATSGLVSKQTVLTVAPYPLSGFYVSPTAVTNGASVRGVVQLTGKAGPNGAVVSLSSGNPCVIVPATVTLQEGATGVSFNVATSPVGSSQSVTVTASDGQSSMDATLTVNPYPISSFYISPSTIVGGVATHGVVQLSGPAGPGGDVVSLSSANPLVTVPASVTVPAGRSGVSFLITSRTVTASQGIIITATSGTSSKQTTVQLNPSTG